MPKSKLQKKKDDPKSSYWKKKADLEWGRVIHLYNKCLVNSECAGNLEAHHLITRSNVITRHKIENGVLLCSSHHKFSNKLSAHKAPIQFSEFLRENYPDKIDWVMENRYITGKPDYKVAYEKLKDIV